MATRSSTSPHPTMPGSGSQLGFGNGDGTFRSSQSYGYSWPAAINAIAAGDLNGDGNLDIVKAAAAPGLELR